MIKFSIEQVYNTVVKHLKAGGKRSVRDYNTMNICSYRGDDGAKCFVGLMIPDDKYHPEFERGMSARAMVENKIIEGSVDFGYALSDLQELHDNPLYWNEDGSFNGYDSLDNWYSVNRSVV
jgi:hypothetical protein